MDDLMKAIMAKAEQEIDDAKDKKKEKPAESVQKVQPKRKPAPPKPKKVIEPTWSAETQETCLMPAMLEPKTPEPKTPEPKTEPVKVEHQDDAKTTKNETSSVEQPSAPIIKWKQAQVDPSIKMYVAMGGSFFGVALLAVIYTALKVTGTM